LAARNVRLATPAAPFVVTPLMARAIALDPPAWSGHQCDSCVTWFRRAYITGDLMNERTLIGPGRLLGLALLLAVGCTPLQIKYSPLPTPAPASATGIVLKVVDNRPPERLAARNQVGQTRDAFGIPHGLQDEDPNVVPRTITDATSDALKQSGIGVQGAGPKTLVATITEFWMDGYLGYKAGVTVQYALLNPAGAPVWVEEVKGNAGAGAFGLNKNEKRMAKNMFETALADLAVHASERFRSPNFQQALAM
jgi:hypothetical protein